MSFSPSQKRLRPGPARRHVPQLAPRYRPALEPLEDRCLLSVGTFDPATGNWYLRDSNSPGAPDVAPFAYGAPGWTPVNGDWDGDGTTTIGVFDPATATWYLRDSNSQGPPTVPAFAYGGPGWIPVVGDWDGDGTTTIGVVDPSTNTWYLRNSNTPGAPDFTPFPYGAPGWLPVVGDWDGDGITTIGVVDPTTETWYLRNSNTPGPPNVTPFAYGGPNWLPVAGDWDNDGTATVGVVDPRTATWYPRNSNNAGPPDVTPFAYGAGAWAPVSPSNLPLNLLRGATEFAGPYPDPTLVTFPDSTGQQQQVLAIPGQVQIFFGASTSQPDAVAAIGAAGGSVLAQTPALDYYLVGVPTGQEGAFITRTQADPRVDYVAPHVVAPLNFAAVVDNNHPGFFPPPDNRSHAEYVKSVVISERGLGPDIPEQIQVIDVAPTNPPSPQGAVIIGPGEDKIVAAVNKYRYQDIYLNLSANGNDQHHKILVLGSLLNDLAGIPETARHNLVFTISAGNDTASLDPVLAVLRTSPRWSEVLDNNFLIVTASKSAPTTSANPDFDVAVLNNPNPAAGTSRTAAAANGRIQRVAYDKQVDGYLALQAAKLAIALNTTGPHDLVISEAEAKVDFLRSVLKAIGRNDRAAELIAVQAAKQALRDNQQGQLLLQEAIAAANRLLSIPAPSPSPSPSPPPTGGNSVQISSLHVNVLAQLGLNQERIQITATGTATATDAARLVPFNYVSGSTFAATGWSVDQNLFQATRSTSQPASTTWTYTSAPFVAFDSSTGLGVADFVIDLYSPPDSSPPVEARQPIN